MIRICDYFAAFEVFDFGDVSSNFIEVLHQNLNDADHMKFSQHRLTNHTLESSQDFLQKLRAKGGRYYSIVSFEGGQIVGTFTVKPLDEKQCEVGILIFREFSNKGIANAIWRSLPRLVEEQGFDFLVSGTHIQNIPMRRVMEQSGMELDSMRNFPNNPNGNSESIYFILKVK